MLIPIFQRLVAHTLQSDFGATHDILLFYTSSSFEGTCFAWIKANGPNIILKQNTSRMYAFKFLLPSRLLEHEMRSRNKSGLCDFFHGMTSLELSKTSDYFQKQVLKSMLLSACECNGVISYFNKIFLPANTRSIEELEIWLDMIDA